MSRTPRCVFLVNPGARDGRAHARVSRALRWCPGLAKTADIVTVRTRAEVDEVVRQLPPDTVPIAAGGDGTVNLVAGALWKLGIDAPMGVVPLGTGNAFAASLGIGGVDQAIQVIANRMERRIDLMVTGHPAAPVATVSLSAGFESQVLQPAASHAGWQRALPVALGLKATIMRRVRGIALEIDGETLLAPDDLVYNSGLYTGSRYAFGRRVYRDADPADGFGEAVVTRTARAYWQIIWRGLDTAKGRDGNPSVRRWQVARVRSSLPLQVDGDVIPPASMEIHLAPRSLRVLSPA